MGESVSIYSEKAYRRYGGKTFEAVGNVVITSGKDTIYGEKASFNSIEGKFKIEGSVRYIGDNITVYGAKIDYDMATKKIEIINARMVTPNFSLVASRISKITNTKYFATEAEFTTCRDCTESWLLSGKEVHIEIGEYIQIYHALAKVKGVDVLYLPYIALPIKNKRESGILFPKLSSKDEEGLQYEQPFYWAINDSSDATFTPTFLSERGYGLDLEYRHVFSEDSWFEFSDKMIIDTIYSPEQLNTSRSDERYFRHFLEFENHGRWTKNLSHHLRVIGSKDNDFQHDFSNYTDNYLRRNDLGLDFYIENRFENFELGLETDYKNNLLVKNAIGFDSNYVQTLPRIYFAMKPQLLWEFDTNYFYKMTYALDSDYTVFKQNRINESGVFRNANRLHVSPEFNLEILSLGPIQLQSKYLVDYESYKFLAEDEENFYKSSGLVSTELNFTVDRIFGLAYDEEYLRSEIRQKDLPSLKAKSEINKNVLSKNIIGALPEIENSLTKEKLRITRNSYRHSQEFKLIHHQLVHNNEQGNQKFETQISEESGWFDYKDAIKENILTLDSNEARKNIPLNNTLELQWNNVLIRKSPKRFNYLVDNRYLKDNFTYKRLGHFNISQGYLLATQEEDFNKKLTRLYLDMAYNADTWYFNLADYYFHQSGDFILKANGEKKFEQVSLLAQYNYNSFSDSNLKTIKSGIQFRPIDVFGLAYLKEYDLDANENISSIYQVDFMPNNNCWIFNINYKDSFEEKRYAINFAFNFGSDDFSSYRTNFFKFDRLSQ